jgi:hypothetical protein
MSNKPLMRADQERRRSNAAGFHPTARRKGTRTARKAAAIRESREGR